MAASATTFRSAQGLMGVLFECTLPTCLALDPVGFLHTADIEGL